MYTFLGRQTISKAKNISLCQTWNFNKTVKTIYQNYIHEYFLLSKKKTTKACKSFNTTEKLNQHFPKDMSLDQHLWE